MRLSYIDVSPSLPSFLSLKINNQHSLGWGFKNIVHVQIYTHTHTHRISQLQGGLPQGSIFSPIFSRLPHNYLVKEGLRVGGRGPEG